VGFDVTVYPVIGAPPSYGAVNVTVACVLPGVADTEVDPLGIVEGVTELLATEAPPVPALVVAVTLKVYGIPLVKPVTTCVNAVDPALLSTPPTGFDVTV
jgi:hypothetical protein